MASDDRRVAVAYRCYGCHFTTSTMWLGRGPRRRQHVAIACRRCADIHVVATSTWRDGAVGARHDESVWRRGSPCPTCADEVWVLDPEPDAGAVGECPRCGRSLLCGEEPS